MRSGRFKDMAVMAATAGVTMTVFIAASFARLTEPDWRGSGGWGAAGSYAALYDPDRTETISGQVVNVGTFVPARGMSPGVRLTVRVGAAHIPVHLGPVWFVTNQDMAVRPGTKVQVTGARVRFPYGTALVAARLRSGGRQLRLREVGGEPVWSTLDCP